MIVKTSNSITNAAEPTIVFVDLDDTLVKTDLLAEACVKAARVSPLALLRALLKLPQGKAAFKSVLADQIVPDASLLPYRTDVLDLIKQQKAAGNKIVLATASPRPWAERVAAHLGLFDDVLASDGENNLKGHRKLQAIQDYAAHDDHFGWAYLGDSKADLPIFAAASRGYLVTSKKSLQQKAHQQAPGRMQILPQPKSSWKSVLKALRPHQWVKNILIFVPMILAHAFTTHQAISALIAWICFSLVASSVYVLNDMLDVESDRRHPRKCRRPFASAQMSLASGIPLILGFLGIGFGLAITNLPSRFVGLLFGYFLLTTLYSFYLKNKLILDVMVLAGLYTLRVVAGGAAVNVPVSEWLMAFSIFLFTSLAFAKRYAELNRFKSELNLHPSNVESDPPLLGLLADRSEKGTEQGATRLHGRSYRVEDLSLIENLGPTSGYLSVLVLALYISSPQVSALYHQSSMLWYVCPLLMYWITRLWFVAKRGKLAEDPIVFALRDSVSLLTGALVCVVLAVSIAA